VQRERQRGVASNSGPKPKSRRAKKQISLKNQRGRVKQPGGARRKRRERSEPSDLIRRAWFDQKWERIWGVWWRSERLGARWCMMMLWIHAHWILGYINISTVQKKFIFSFFSLLTALSLSVCAQTGAAVVGAGRWRHRAGNFNQSKKVNFIY
jgi:hypothetical protein